MCFVTNCNYQFYSYFRFQTQIQSIDASAKYFSLQAIGYSYKKPGLRLQVSCSTHIKVSSKSFQTG